ncbi:MAG: DUF6263 family protein [Ferruginibacter sp.]
MKKGLFLLAAFTYLHSSAQSVEFKKGQQILITTTASQSTDLMGMGMKNSSTSINKVIVKEVTDKNYTLENTLTKLVVNSENPMQPINFDSDKEQDRSSEVGKAIGSSLDKPEIFFVNKKSSEITSDNKNMADSIAGGDKNDMMSMMGGMFGNAESATVSNTFFLIPAGKKTGDSWSDSSTIEKIKSVNKYTIESTEKNIVTIAVNGTMNGKTTMDMQGNQFDIDMSTTTTGKIILDKSTSLVKSRTTNATINSTVQAMGQSLPVDGTATSTTTYE